MYNSFKSNKLNKTYAYNNEIIYILTILFLITAHLIRPLLSLNYMGTDSMSLYLSTEIRRVLLIINK